MGQALMGHPDILVLDEPVAGVHPSFVDDIASLLLDTQSRGVSLLVVEHNLRFLEAIAERVIVMAAGRVLTQGTLADVRRRDDVAEAYLGRRESARRTPGNPEPTSTEQPPPVAHDRSGT
jgi:branched-chain amino acid transport system ATP-binding protein